MPRPLRIQVAGGLYHVTAHSNVGRVAFSDDEDRAQFLAMLDEVVRRYEWSCRSYCLLSTHFHLLFLTPQADLAAGMQYLNGRYAQWANRRRSERGHIFEGRYYSVLVESEGHALEAHRYIALNPVRAGLVHRPEEWLWSSVPAVLGLRVPPRFLDVRAVHEEFGPNSVSARRRIRTFIRDALAQDMP
jgi:REP element-mobilizing transposase RayT